MKKITLFILAMLFIILNISAQNRHIVVGKNYENPNEITLVAERGVSTTIKFDLNELNLTEVETNYGLANKISSAKATIMLDAGSPELFYLPTAVIIPDLGSAELEITTGEYTEYTDIEIVPSKGNILRSVDPATIPYTKGEVYSQDAFFPGTLAQINETFIMRDVRGLSLFVYPVQYNPVTKTLRIYSEITVTVNYTETKGENEFTTQKRHASIDPEFNAIYSGLFINHSVLQQRGYPTGEAGEILIICHTPWANEMKDYVDWKRTTGRKTTLVTTATAGTTAAAVKTYIQNYYNNPANNLAFVLLVGDAAQIPSQMFTGGSPSPAPGDILFGEMTGDNYLEILVGRMSSENVAHVQTQVQRAVDYERNPTTADTWIQNAMGVAANEGSGGGHDGGEADYVHMNNIRNRLLNYGYTTVHQDYTSGCGVPATSAAQITQHVNAGISLGNYCNHGSVTAWTLTGGVTYSTSNVNQLQNAGKLPFIFSVACNNGEFTNSQVCFAEAWARASQGGQPTGAVASLMGSISMSWLPPMTGQDEFVNIIMDLPSPYGNTAPIMRTIAGAMLNASQKMYMKHGSSGLNDLKCWNLFGDPSLMFRTKTPQAMTVTHNPNIPSTATSLSVTCVSGALAALTYVNSSNEVIILGTAVAGTNNIAVINFTMPTPAPENVKLAVTGFNKVTYLATIPVSSSQPQFCEKPINVQGSASGNTATITWNPPVNIDGVLTHYYIYRNGNKIDETLPTITQYVNAGLANGSYTYKISAKYQHCESPQTDGTLVTIFVPQYCEPPVNLTTSVNENNVTITWNAPVNVDGTLLKYLIYRDGSKIGETLPSVKEYVDENLPNGTYAYKVSAVYEHCGESAFTGEKTVTVFVPQYCEPPVALSTSVSENNVTITWDAPVNIDGTLLGYKVHRNGAEIGVTLPSVREFEDNNLPNGTYTYKVNAEYEHCGNSEFSNEETVTVFVPQFCEPPVELTGESGDFFVTLQWKKPENIDGILLGYNIYRDSVKVNNELVTELEYRDEGLKEDTEYRYQLSAVYEHCVSDLTDVFIITTIHVDGIENYLSKEIVIYPNPTNGLLTIENGQLKIEKVEIFDVFGRKVETWRAASLQSYDITLFPAGVFFIKIETEKGVVTKKIIKVH